MKKAILLLSLLIASVCVKAQWVDDPARNTRLANCASGAGEVYVSTDISTGDTYIQWHYQGENGWSPWVQRLNAEGVAQWPADGIHVTTPNCATWSPGYSMTAVEGGVVTVFRTLGPHHWAVKINDDGTFPWGEHGLMLFNGEGGGRSEVLAGDDGGVWALGTDMDSTFLQYVNPNGTLRASVTINDPVKKCTNGILVPANDGVFVVYAKQTIQGYSSYVKEIYVAGYDKDGTLTVPETLLLGQQTVGMSYVHYAVSDGMGGGYVYQWHNGIGGVYNTYVTHFNADGEPSIAEPNGIPVHSPDPSHYYTNAYPTVDPASHDLIIAYRQTDSGSQTQDMVMMNRITPTGEKVWDDGLNVTETIGDYSDIKVDHFGFASGFAVIYGTGANTIEAVGYDLDDASEKWRTTMSTSSHEKSISENTSGYHVGQNIIAWVNSSGGGVYGQNIGENGEMGEITVVPPIPYEPDNFEGSYLYNEETSSFGAMLTWGPPGYSPLHYNLYRQQLDNGIVETIEVDAESTSYFDETTPGTYKYQLTAVYEDSESGYALTPDGQDYLIIEVTTVPETADTEFVTITDIYTASGQRLRKANLDELSPGVYVIQGLTSDGKLVTRKMIVK